MNLTVGLKEGERVERTFEGKGTVISAIGIGVVVQFDNGKIEKIQDGLLKRISD